MVCTPLKVAVKLDYHQSRIVSENRFGFNP